MINIIYSLNTKVKAAQSVFSNFVDGKIPTISDIVENTILVNNPDQNKKSTTLEIDSDCQINAKGRLALLNPACPIHGTEYITENGWTSNILETITGDKAKIIRQMHICSECRTVFLPSLNYLKIPYGRITKDGQRYLLELTIEDGLSLRKAKRRLKNTFGLEIYISRLWYLIQSTGIKSNEKTNELTDSGIKFSGIVCYDEKILRKTVKNVVKMTVLDAIYGYAIKEDVKENKKSKTIGSFLIDALEDKPILAIVTDCDPKYPDIVKNNFPDAQLQLCVGHFNDIVDDDIRIAAGLNYSKKKELPKEYQKLKGEIHYIFSSKSRIIAEKKLYSLMERELGKDEAIDELLMKTKAYFPNLTHFMDDVRIPKTNNKLESWYSTMEANYNNNRRFKSIEGANNYCSCQTLFRNFYEIKEGTYINSSPYSRAGLDHGDDDWLNVLEFGDKIYKFIKTIDKAILSKIGYI